MLEISLKKVCCTCLSTNRVLNQLCRIDDGVNLLYMLLTRDPDAYKEGFYKDTASLHICWECTAILQRIKHFQLQACAVQIQLSAVADGRNDVKLTSFSRLTTTKITKPNFYYQHSDIEINDTENFIDCGHIKEIKTESDDDVPLSAYSHNWANNDIETANNDIEIENKDIKNVKVNEFVTGNDDMDYSMTDMENNIDLSGTLNNDIENSNNDIENINNDIENCSTDLSNKLKVKNNKKSSKINTKEKYIKYYSIKVMDKEEIQNVINAQRKSLSESDVLWKCESCVIAFKTENELTEHNVLCHEKKANHIQCEICCSYVADIITHKQTHSHKYVCVICIHITYTQNDIVKHIRRCHKSIGKRKKKKKGLNNGFVMEDNAKYPCPECDASFQNKDLRWKHVQKTHREGFKCKICDKKFAFKNNLERHERIHSGTLPREQCPTCNKMVRVDVLRAHTLTHAHRHTHTCVECDKTFVSRATYESHLKYARAHATGDVCRHKCPSCHKRYRSGGELKDHINYYHNGQATHKCPICGKGLATKRCIKRHVRRTHEGIKENAKDKICQQCGKAFRDKKSLCENERVHSGARPLSCASCGRAFRQRAALYAHMKRIHKIK